MDSISATESSYLQEPLLPFVSDVNSTEQNDAYDHLADIPLEHDEDDHESSSSDQPSSPASSGASSPLSSSHTTAASYVNDYRFASILRKAKRNIRRTLALTFFTFCSRSIWSQTALSLFLALKYPHHLEYVGYVTATMGIFQVASSSMAKYLLRRYQLFHNAFLRFTSLVGILATAASVKAILIHNNNDTTDSTANMIWLFAAMALWGTVWGISESILPVVFMESATLMERPDKKFRRCSRLIKFGNVCGTAIALGIFYWLGNQWTIYNCAVVMVVGLFLNLQVFFLLCSLRILPIDEDDEDINDLENDYIDDAIEEQRLELTPEEDDNLRQQENEALLTNVRHEDLECPQEDQIAESSGSGQSAEVSPPKEACNCLRNAYIPLLISVADILSSFAGGVSIRYFPIFLAQDLRLQPVHVQALCLLVPLGQWVSSSLAKKLAKCSGPLQVSIILQWIFVILMVSMIIGHEKDLSTWGVCVLYVLHGSLMNSTSSLTQTTLSQCVSEETIQKWRVADKFQMVLWALGSALGGYLAGRFGISTTFFSTGAVQLVASLPLVLLYFTKPSVDSRGDSNNVNDHASVTDQDGQSCVSNDGSGTLFEDCICDIRENCKDSPAVSDTTSDTQSTASSDDGHDHSSSSDSSDASFVSIPQL